MVPPPSPPPRPLPPLRLVHWDGYIHHLRTHGVSNGVHLTHLHLTSDTAPARHVVILIPIPSPHGRCLRVEEAALRTPAVDLDAEVLEGALAAGLRGARPRLGGNEEAEDAQEPGASLAAVGVEALLETQLAEVLLVGAVFFLCACMGAAFVVRLLLVAHFFKDDGVVDGGMVGCLASSFVTRNMLTAASWQVIYLTMRWSLYWTMSCVLVVYGSWRSYRKPRDVMVEYRKHLA